MKLLIVLLLIILCTSSAQDNIVYQPEQLQNNLLKFKAALIQTHPGIYEYQTLKDFKFIWINKHHKVRNNLIIFYLFGDKER